MSLYIICTFDNVLFEGLMGLIFNILIFKEIKRLRGDVSNNSIAIVGLG